MISVGRRTHITALACAALVYITGCSGQDGQESSGGPDAPSPSASATNLRPSPLESYLKLPIEAYSFSADQLYVISKAERKLADSCMRKYGLRYKAAASDSPAKYIPGTNRRYGVMNADVVATYGYHFPETTAAASELELTEQEVLALNGKPGTSLELNGVEVPEGGCLGQAKKNLRGKYAYEEGVEVAQSIALGSFEKSLTAPSVGKATKEWSQCMKKRGFSYSTPLRALAAEENSGEEITKREISAATADVDCKTQTHLVRIWSRQEAEMQKSMIKESRKELDRLSEAHEKLLTEARSVGG
ncbi:hypothetical protein ACFYO0_14825 [Streptomyces sp. NPDC006365]|uniref:hypothetical protein n=1 Tax=Streptomyces sp. NPDC006365 TaxID=3364744 RepID=UPI0036C98AA9